MRSPTLGGVTEVLRVVVALTAVVRGVDVLRIDRERLLEVRGRFLSFFSEPSTTPALYAASASLGSRRALVVLDDRVVALPVCDSSQPRA